VAIAIIIHLLLVLIIMAITLHPAVATVVQAVVLVHLRLQVVRR
jgi:hypothetical protein